jgi:hypothetical protein
MFEGLRKPTEVIVIVVTLLSYGCPVQAIVHAFGLDERTVASWRDRAGAHCEQVHQALIETGKLNLVHVQADEIRVKGRNLIAWMGLAMMVSTRLWLAGTVSVSRDKGLADALMQQVRSSAQILHPFLVLTDGWAAYPNSIRRAFREKVKKLTGVGRASLEVWPHLSIGTVIKRSENRYKVAPSPWVEPKRRGQPKKQGEQTVKPTNCQSFQPRLRPLVRLRKGLLCSTTS